MPVILGGSVGRGLKNGEESISSLCPLVMAVGASSMGLGVILSALGCMDLKLHHRDCWVSKFYAEPPSICLLFPVPYLWWGCPRTPTPELWMMAVPTLQGIPGTWHNVYSCLEVTILSPGERAVLRGDYSSDQFPLDGPPVVQILHIPKWY